MMSTSLLNAPPPRLTSPALAAALAGVLEGVAAASSDVDGGCGDLDDLIRHLGDRGLVSLGTSVGGSLLDQAVVLSELAERCMASAFVTWAHRMTVEYLDVIGTAAALALGSALRAGDRLGSTAMADAFRDLAGIAELPLTYRRTEGGVVVDGSVAWASNLRPGALIVTAARDGDAPDPATAERLVIAVTVGDVGLGVRPSVDLLALDATASGSLRFDGVQVDHRHVLTADVATFLRRVRPTFLVLQTSFCLGLVRAALDAVPVPRGVGESFCDDLEFARRRADRAWSELADLSNSAREQGVSIRPYLQARLDAAHLARDATHVELCLTGGRGYSHASPTARRLREAAFLPVQSPTEGQLRWELSRSA